ncbi:hypothetical protein QNI16_24035 [Cytophagaceae bacterium YF14B1]|uniref:Uncharacterized protein n=1 Tax=Xanthocytophaga flava TaxID=3048013 RepID=A0AAE3QUA2_9BACT|nr:hypothetical protein [Xanthocytophaga flavus]MDJ1483590.1 hypothetical protein [Xanthocytophaga flavus]
MKKTLYIIWEFIVVVSICLKCYYTPKIPPIELCWKANKKLQALHQLEKNDLTLSNPTVTMDEKSKSLDSLIGHHLLREKKEGDIIRSLDVSTFPKITEKNSLVWLLRLNKEEILLNNLVREGTLIKLCSIDEKSNISRCTDSIQLLAVHNPKDSTETAFWILNLQSSQAIDIGHFATTKNRYILINSLD